MAIFKPYTKDALVDEEESIYVGIFNVTAATMEFDSLFTVIQTRNCSGNQLLLVWIFLILWISMTASLNNNDYVWVDSAFGAFFIMSIMTTFGLFLLGDNSQPLDCISSLSNRSRSILRLIFLLLSCSVYLVLFVYLFLAQTC